jgi:Tol biopolymer transport system component
VQRRSRRWRTVTIQVLAVVAAALATVLAERAFSRAYPKTAPPVELRLSIAPPTGYEFTHDVADYNPDFAVSPDGRDLAFIAVDANGTRLLWIRSLSSVAARPVSGTDGARRPFWSPDGQHVGYVGVNGLSRVPVAGGAPQLLVQLGPAMVDSNASWGASGLIAFDRFVSGSGEGARALFVVSDAGGPVRQIPRGAHHENELAQRYPTFLPDGRRFLYQSWSADPANRGIYLGSLDSEARTLIVKTGFRAEFVAPGHLLYIRDRALVAQRLSLEPPGLAGEPQVIVEGLAIEAIPGQATFAASASGVVLYRSRDRETVSELSWFDRGSRALTPAAARASDITVSLAPNGRLAATTRLSLSSAPEERPPGNLWLIDLPRGVASRLTLDPSTIDENPVWSPDGTRLAYAVHHGSSLAEVVVTSATEVSDAKTVASGSENFHPVAWSRDGRHLLLQAYATGSGGDDLDLWVLPIKAGGAPVPYIQAPFAQAQGQFSPNGRFVAYTSDESGRSEIYVRPFGVAGPRSQISPQGGSQPRWRPDGREMFYVSPAGTLTAVEVDTRSEFRASAPIALFSEPSLRANNSLFFYGGAAGYDVAPDGKRFLVNRMIRQPSGGPLQVVLNAIRR